MKITVLFDNSINAFKKEPKEITIRGAQPEHARELVDEYFKIIMLGMGYNHDTVEDFLGDR